MTAKARFTVAADALADWRDAVTEQCGTGFGGCKRPGLCTGLSVERWPAGRRSGGC